MEELRQERRKEMNDGLILGWPTIGDASESALIKFW